MSNPFVSFHPMQLTEDSRINKFMLDMCRFLEPRIYKVNKVI